MTTAELIEVLELDAKWFEAQAERGVAVAQVNVRARAELARNVAVALRQVPSVAAARAA